MIMIISGQVEYELGPAYTMIISGQVEYELYVYVIGPLQVR